MTFLPGRLHRSCASALALAVATSAPAAETAGQAPAAPSASGAYGEKVDLVTDSSVAESLARQKTVNFSSVRIDGEASDVSLSALTAEQILNAVATKVPTPDLDADAVGGLLQLTSRRAFEQKERTLRGNLAVSHDPLVGQLLPDASITYGRSFATGKKTGFLATLEHRRGRDRDEDVGLNWDFTTGQLDRFQVREQEERRVETNLNGSFDAQLGPRTVGFVRAEGQASSERDLGRGFEYDLPLLNQAPPSAGAPLTDVTLKQRLETGLRRRDSWSLAAGATHQGERWVMDLRSTYRLARDRRVDDRSYDFEEDDIALLYLHPEASFPVVRTADGGIPGNPTRLFLEEIGLSTDRERESEAVASFDVTRLRREGGSSAWLKSGFKARLRRTTEAGLNEVHVPAGAGTRASDVAAGPRHEVVGRRYALAAFPDLAALRRRFDSEPQRFQRDEAKTRSDTDPGNYDVRERVLAGYAMASFPVGAARIVAGARVEQTTSRFTGNEVAFDEFGRYAGTTSLAARRTHTDLFPGVHLSRALAGNLTAFASWTRSIRRPDYTDLVPARQISRAEREIEEGNADLRSALYTNYDVAFDYAYRDDGQVSLELFRREIEDPTLTRRTLLTEGQFAGYERRRPENGGSAWLQGLELTWQQELTAVHRQLAGLEFKLHYTHQDSRQSVESRPGEALPLTERARHALAVELAYERGDYYASVELEQASRTLNSIGRRAAEDRFNFAANHWNISLSRAFRQGLRVFLDVKNLTATPNRSYAGDPSRPDQYSIDLREFRFGLKWEK